MAVSRITLTLASIAFACSVFVLGSTRADGQSQFTSRRWLQLDGPTKLAVLHEFIELARRDRIHIRQSPEYYVRELDALAELYLRTDNQQALDSSLGVALHTLAAMDGDWDNGEPKLEHARRWMGDWFETFRTRFPDKYRRLVED